MTHDEMNDLYELYLLGTLEVEQAAEIDQHVHTQCAYCLQRIQEAAAVTLAMCGLAEDHNPPARLRRRVLASVRPEARSRSWLFAVAGLSAACAALLALTLWSVASARSDRTQIAVLMAERNQLRETIEILSKSDTRTVQFGRNSQAHGRVFLNRSEGLVFIGSQLPALARDRTFQLWLIPATGAPQSAGLFRPNAAGNFVNVQTMPVDTARIHAVAVSVEPVGGSTAPTTTPILIVPLA